MSTKLSEVLRRRTLAAAMPLACLPLALLFTATMHGQVLTGEIDGTVRDSSGALVGDAVVTITNSDQNLVIRTVKTNSKGEFTAPLLTIGTYQVSVAATGFKAEAVTAIDVHVGQPSSVPVVLSTGGTSEEVTVSASSVAPQLESAAAGTLIDTEQVTELPLSSRNYLQLLAIQPGISGGIPGRNDRGNIRASGAVATQNFSVNGNPNTGNGFYLDGADTLKRAGQQPVTFPGPDFIQEINLQRAAYGAEFGGPGSAVTSVQTKAGGSTYHGGAFAFFRSKIFNANDYFQKIAGIPRGGEHYGDLGYYIGGPVWIPKIFSRNNAKTFFFFGQEYLRSEQAVLQNISNVPTLAQRQGTFTTPICLVATNPCPTASKSTTVATIDPTAQAYLKDVINNVPLPNNPNDVQGLIYNTPGTNNETQTIIRIDRQFTSKLSAFFRYLDDPFNLSVANGFQQTSLIPGVGNSAITNGSTNWLGHATYVIGSRFVLEGGYTTRANWVTAHSTGLLTSTSATDVNVKLPYANNLDHVPQLHIGASTYNVSGPYDERGPQQQIFVNSTSSLGRHTLKAGFNLELQRQGSNQGGANAGNFTFTAVATPGATGTPGQPGFVPATTVFSQAFAQFLQGRVSQFTQASSDIASSAHLNLYEGYVQDDFKATPRLTLLAGVRYSYFAAGSTDTFENRAPLPGLNFLPSAFNPANAPTLDNTGLICTTAPCAGGGIPNPSYNATNGIIVAGLNSPFGNAAAAAPAKNFAPRAGFTYDVFGNGTTAVRGGYGLYFFSQIGNPTKFATNQDPPNVTTTTISNTSFGNPGNGVASFSPAPQPLQGYSSGGVNPYTQQYSFDVQQQLRPGLVLDLGYYGNHSVHLPVNIDLNQPLGGAVTPLLPTVACPAPNQLAKCYGTVNAGTNQLNLVRPYKGYSYISYSSTSFFSKYNSLQTSLRERFRGGVLVTLNYTWSKALTNARAPQDNTNLIAEYGHTDNDRKHVFNAAFVYPLPFYAKQTSFIGKVVGGFQVSGIVQYASGFYLTPGIGATDPAGLGLLAGGPSGARPNQVGDPNQNAPHGFAQWFNTSAFVPQPNVTQVGSAVITQGGTARPSTIIGPGYGVWNMNLEKNVKFRDKQNLQFRGEAYNVFNHANFQNLGTTVGATNFGQVTSTGESRNLQLGAKYTF